MKYGQEIKQYIENIKDDEQLTRFCKEIQKLGTKDGSGHMVRLGFYSAEDLDTLSYKFPENLVEARWQAFEMAVLEMGYV